MGKLIIDGNSVYEIDEECIREKEKRETKRESTGNQQGVAGRNNRNERNGKDMRSR